MIKFINNFLNKRKQNKLANKIAVLQEQAMIFQRNGNLRMYAVCYGTNHLELEKQIDHTLTSGTLT